MVEKVIPEKLGIVMSTAMKDALGVFATRHSESMMATIRRAIAKEIGYDLVADPIGKGGAQRGKYATPEERYHAQLTRQKTNRQLSKKLLEEYHAQQRQADIEAMSKSVASRAK